MILRPSNIDRIYQLRTMFLLLIGLVGLQGVRAQGWERSFGGNQRPDEGHAIIQTIDLGYLAVGSSESFGNDNDLDVYVVKTDVDGFEVWSEVYDEAFREQAYDVIQASDGTFVIVGEIEESPGNDRDVFVLKISANGQLIWSKIIDGGQDDMGLSITPGVEGGYLIAGESRNSDTGNSDFLLLKISDDGEQEWLKVYGDPEQDDRINSIATLDNGYAFVGKTERVGGFDNEVAVRGLDSEGNEVWSEDIKTMENEVGNAIITTSDGNIAICGSIGDNSDAFVAKFNTAGEQLWLTTIKVPGENDLGEVSNAITELEDGSLVITGFAERAAGINIDILLAGVSSDGEQLWYNTAGHPLNTDSGQDIVSTHDGGYIITGFNSALLSFINDLSLVKTDGAGNTITSYIKGSIFGEFCNNFEPTGNLPKEGWLVEAVSEDNTYYASTDENGVFIMRVDTGEYTVNVLPITSYWKTCIQGYEVNVTEFYDTTDQVNFPVAPEINCPYLEIDVSAPFLAVCSEVVYTLSYCNLGTAVAEDAYVEVVFDNELSFESSQIPFSSKKDSLYTFDLGDLDVSECGSFSISTSLACEGIAQNQSSFISAHIFPDTLCTEPDPNWDRSSVVVSGTCIEDSVQFTIKNVGDGDMQTPSKAVVIEADVIFWESPVQLPSDKTFATPAFPANGETHRIIVEQSPGHPGRSFPTLAIEGCNNEGVIQTGFVTQFPENDLDPYISIDVQEISTSGQTVGLRGYPKGYGDDAFISPNTDLKYTIIYSNNSTDVIDRVVIRDTLPVGLDIRTVQPGSSSHPYRFEVYDEGILKFTFEDLSLTPNSSTGSPTSTGYLTYSVKQNQGNEPGMTIDHRAAVFFENQAPVITNTVSHTIGEGDYADFVETDIRVVSTNEKSNLPGVEVTVQPNPFKEVATFEIKSDDPVFQRDLYFELWDYSGKRLRTQRVNGNRFKFDGSNLSSGLYVYKLVAGNTILNVGKIIVE